MELLESVLGYTFQDPRKLTEALTHGSLGYELQRNQTDNQRLEFLGDAVLQLSLSEMLFLRLADADEGVLTKARAQLVSTKALAQVARRLQLGGFLLMGRGEEANGGRERESTLADALEAIAGAIYLDGGMDAAQGFARRLFTAELDRLGNSPEDQNPKGQLQELIQAVSTEAPTYQITQESGPDHAKSFEAIVNWQGNTLGRGLGRSKKEAEIEAARAALHSGYVEEMLKKTGHAVYQATKISSANCEQSHEQPPQMCEQSAKVRLVYELPQTVPKTITTSKAVEPSS